MLITSYWIRSRLYIIYSICIDLVLFSLFFMSYKLYIFGNKIILFNIIFLSFWILSSYIIGRYHNTYLSIIESIKHIFFSIINFFVFFSSVYFFYSKLLELNYSNGFGQNFIIFIKFIFTSFLFQYFF